MRTKLTVNGRVREVVVEPRTTLLDTLRDVLHSRKIDVSHEAAFAGDEAAVLAHAPVGRHELEPAGAHRVVSSGRLAPRMRSAASAIASTICA